MGIWVIWWEGIICLENVECEVFILDSVFISFMVLGKFYKYFEFFFKIEMLIFVWFIGYDEFLIKLCIRKFFVNS